MFCSCVLFNSSEHAFVRDPINDWTNLGSLVKPHSSQPGHSKCLEMSDHFLSVAEGNKEDAVPMLSSAYQDKITRNRLILKSILKIDIVIPLWKTKYSLWVILKRKVIP